MSAGLGSGARDSLREDKKATQRRPRMSLLADGYPFVLSDHLVCETGDPSESNCADEHPLVWHHRGSGRRACNHVVILHGEMTASLPSASFSVIPAPAKPRFFVSGRCVWAARGYSGRTWPKAVRSCPHVAMAGCPCLPDSCNANRATFNAESGGKNGFAKSRLSCTHK
jgi:hypothetical protein